MNNLDGIISTINQNPHVTFCGMAFMALPAYGKQKGRKVIHVHGESAIQATDAEIKAAFVRANGGRFVRNRWYK